MNVRNVGDYSERVTPLPIPNREVKSFSADGTTTGGRVSRRQLNIYFIKESSVVNSTGLFLF